MTTPIGSPHVSKRTAAAHQRAHDPATIIERAEDRARRTTRRPPKDEADWLRYFKTTAEALMREERDRPDLHIDCPACGRHDRLMDSKEWGRLCWYCWRTRHDALPGPHVTCRRCSQRVPAAATCTIMCLEGRFCYPYCLTPERRMGREAVQLALL